MEEINQMKSLESGGCFDKLRTADSLRHLNSAGISSSIQMKCNDVIIECDRIHLPKRRNKL